MDGLRGNLCRRAARTWIGIHAGRGKRTIKRFWQFIWLKPSAVTFDGTAALQSVRLRLEGN